MKYSIKNPSDDHHDNQKENIFIAFDEIGNPIGNAYVYPVVNYYQTYKTPYMIYFELMIGIQVEDICGESLRKDLFDKVYERAIVLRNEQSHLETKFYTGFMNDPEKLKCYHKKGFDDDCTIIMKLETLRDTYVSQKKLTYKDLDLDDEAVIEEYLEIHNKLFINPLDIELLLDMAHSEQFKCVSVFDNTKYVGGCTLFIEDGLGFIEKIFVTPEYIGKGYSKEILSYALNYFIESNAQVVELEVRKSNERAVKLFEQFGFKEMAINIMFPSLHL